MIYDFEAHTTECDACLEIDKKMEMGSQLGEARLDLLVQKDRVGRHDSRLVDSAHDSNPARGFSTPLGAVCEHHQSSGKTRLPKSQPHKNIRADSRTANPCFFLKPSARRLRTPDTWSAAHRISSLGDGQLLHARGASCPGTNHHGRKCAGVRAELRSFGGKLREPEVRRGQAASTIPSVAATILSRALMRAACDGEQLGSQGLPVAEPPHRHSSSGRRFQVARHRARDPRRPCFCLLTRHNMRQMGSPAIQGGYIAAKERPSTSPPRHFRR